MPDAVAELADARPAPPPPAPREAQAEEGARAQAEAGAGARSRPRAQPVPRLVVAGAVLAAIVGFLAGGRREQVELQHGGGTPTPRREPGVGQGAPALGRTASGCPSRRWSEDGRRVRSASTPGGDHGRRRRAARSWSATADESADNPTLLADDLRAAARLPAKEAVELSGGHAGRSYRT